MVLYNLYWYTFFQNTENNLSIYNQIVFFLNTKNNFIVIFFFISTIFLNENTKYNFIKILYVGFIFLYFFFENNFWFFEKNFWFQNSINLNLTNGVLLIHPPLIYLYYAYIGNYIHVHVQQNKFKKKFTNTSPRGWVILSIINFSILLGCYWAEQELYWGGWWSWDFVEILSLFLLLVVVFILHNKISLITNKFIYNIFIYIIGFSIISVKFNLINSLHNFVSTQLNNQTTIYLYIYVLCIFYIVFFKKKNSKNIFNMILYITFVVFVLSNIYLILNNIQLLSFKKILYTIIYLYTYLYIIYIWYTIPFLFLVQNIPFINTLLYSIILLFYLQPSKYKNIHTGLLLIFLFCFFDVYIFFENYITAINNNLVLFKKNQYEESVFLFLNLDYDYFCFKVCTSIKENIQNSNHTSTIFEKIIIFTKYLQEVYSFDVQHVIFVWGFCLLMFTIFLVNTFLKKFFKKKVFFF